MARRNAVPEKASRSSLPFRLVIVGIILLSVSSWYWWSKIYSNPARVFEGMLRSSLSTGSVTRDVKRAAQGNIVDEHITVNLGAQNRSRTITTVSRGSGSDQARVVTESIGTLQDDYGRYINIDTKETGPSGAPLDFREVLNVWGKSDQAASGQQNSASFLNDALIGTLIVPIANLNPHDRQALLQQIKADKVYDIDYTTVKRSERDGRSVYVYEVSVHPKPYIAMMQAFTRNIGLGQVEGLDQSNYEGAAALKLEVVVDILSRQLVQIRYPASERDPGRLEQYGSYGLKREILIPKDTIPLSDLQQRLQNLQ